MKSDLNKFRSALIIVLLQLALFLSNNVSMQAAESLGDPFEGNALKNPNWKWSNEPKKWDLGKTREGWLTITGEFNRNLWGDDQSNRLYQKHSGDFHVETHLIHDYRDGSTVQGIVVGEHELKLKDPLQVSIYSGIAEAPGAAKLTSHFEYFKDLDNPFPVEVQNKLTTTWGTLKQAY